MMKKLMTVLALFTFMTSLTAQTTPVSTTTFEDASLAAHELVLQANADKVIEIWDDYWDERYDVDIDREDRNRKREVYNAKEVMVSAIADKQLDVYSKVASLDENTSKVSLGIGFGYDVYASSINYSTAYDAARQVLADFEPFFYQRYFAEKLEAAQETVAAAKSEQEDLQDDLTKSDRKIERWEKDIADLRERIEEERAAIEENREALNGQTEKVTRLEAELREVEQMASRWQ